MAMITCPECGKQISEYSTVCIGCGASMEIIKKLLSETESHMDFDAVKAESNEVFVQEQLTYNEFRAEEQIKNRSISCIICGTKYDVADHHCPVCKYPSFALSSNINMKAFQEHFYHSECRFEEQIKNRKISCIICRTKYDAADQHCPVCKYPALALSSSIDMKVLQELIIQYNGKTGKAYLNMPLLTRAYSLSESDELEQTISRQRLKEIVEEYKKKSEQGNLYAQTNLGMLIICCGQLLPEVIDDHDIYDKAIQLLRIPTEKGISEAQLFYGIMLVADPSRKKEGVAWIKKAAEQGNVEAQYYIGDLYYDGEDVEQDYIKAAEWFRKAAAQGNKAAADRLAELGGAEKQYQLGKKYYFGKGVEENYTKAVECFLNAADQGHADAPYFLGKMYERGEGVEQDYIKAEDWYLKAADQGKTEAWLDLGLLYEYKIKDYTKAEKCYRKKAERGDRIAQYLLGSLYNYKIRDYTKAAEWYSKAAAQGDKMAADSLAELNKGKGLLGRLDQLQNRRSSKKDAIP